MKILSCRQYVNSSIDVSKGNRAHHISLAGFHKNRSPKANVQISFTSDPHMILLLF